jgi:hypothetical protein
MPVRKFRSVDELNRPFWRRPGDPALYEAIAAVWALGRRTAIKRLTPGVRRFPSIEAMNAAQRGE